MRDKYIDPDYYKLLDEINRATISFLQDDATGVDKQLMGLAMSVRACMSTVHEWLDVFGEKNQTKAVPNPTLEWSMHVYAHVYCAKNIITALHIQLVDFGIIKIQDETDISDKNTG